MKVVIRSPYHATLDRYACVMPEFYTFFGDEVPAPKWMSNALCLTTGDPKWPIRVLDRDRIVSIDDTKSDEKQKPTSRVLEVAGSKGNTYVVNLEGSRASCTCAGFQFRGKCKHIEEALKKFS
jgi:hypothetical protein